MISKILKIIWFAMQLLTLVNCGNYVFYFEDDNIITPCSKQNEQDLKKFIDVSNLKAVFKDDGTRYFTGNATVLWDAQSTDLIALHCSLYKYSRGTWQETMFTISRMDFCNSLYDETEFWYDGWSKYVYEEDRKCINMKNLTYRLHPLNDNFKLIFPGLDQSGKYKIEVHFVATDTIENAKEPLEACVAIVGELVKISK